MVPYIILQNCIVLEKTPRETLLAQMKNDHLPSIFKKLCKGVVNAKIQDNFFIFMRVKHLHVHIT